MLSQVKYPLKKATAGIILSTGLIVGTLDIVSAFVDYYIATGKNPLAVLPYIASGAFGDSALSGGAGMMIAGLFFHYIIAYSFTIFFFWLYPRASFFSINRILTGIGYGIFIWLVMNLVVVQLSAAPHSPIPAMKPLKILKSMGILIFMIGLPLSFIAYNYFFRELTANSSTNNADRPATDVG
jgi:hypothetical protein